MASPKRPNILFIMDDQHRHDYLGCAGAGFVRTPHLDRLAERGIRFTHCCTHAPVCAPARVGLATGLQPFRLGGLDNASAFVPRGIPTLYQHLRDAGYRVGCVGKLDLRKQDPYNGRYGDRPLAYSWGFTHPEECEGKMHAGSSPTPIGPYTHFLAQRGLLQPFYEDYRRRARLGWCTAAASYDSVLPADAFEDVYIGQRAAAWLEWVPDDFPWFLFVSFVGPHDPYDPPSEYARRYRDAAVPPPLRSDPHGKPAWVRRRQQAANDDEVAITRRQYCAAIEVIDRQVGEILAALERRGMADHTWIVFTSDHGEMLGDHGLYAKSVAYESALRVPLLLAGPGLEGGRTCSALVELLDLHPTVLELAGLAPQPGLDGRSLLPLLRGETAQHRTEIVSTLRPFRCVRTERYKLIENVNDLTELYDLEQDPEERHNLAPERPDLVRELLARLRRRTLEQVW